MWAVAGLEGGWTGLGRPSHCSPPPLPFPPTDKLWFCCLSPNHKVLQYGDVEEGVGPPTPESLPEQREEGMVAGRYLCSPEPPHPGAARGLSGQPSLFPAVPVANIRALLTGKDCPHVREKGSGKQNKVSAVGARAASHQPLLSAPGSLAFPGCLGVSFLSQL